MHATLHPMYKTERNQEAQRLGGKQVRSRRQTGRLKPAEVGPAQVPSAQDVLPDAKGRGSLNGFQMHFMSLCLNFFMTNKAFSPFPLSFPKMLPVPFRSELAIYTVDLG